MIAVERSNDPGGFWPVDPASEMVRLKATGGDVRELQRALGCHFRARVSGRVPERGVCRYYIREVIAVLNPVLRGGGNYFRTGNAAVKFVRIDRYVWWRLVRLLVKRRGRNLKPGQVERWPHQWLVGLGLHQLMGTIRYPGIA
ncbi:MAG TPA: group II intron maturase-specific domain-containing protein [Solirubrobacteraceae bacterium]|jgi:RNA-directed DNA polymerase|nr:group II intron maturase-specific domain-containing protein [Solirubrobacteraceae bacterium]